MTRRVTVRQTNGLHMRPAELVARTAGRYAAEVTLAREDLTVDAKSILDLISLAAEQHTELVLEARGEDAEAAADELTTLFESDFEANNAAGEPGL